MSIADDVVALIDKEEVAQFALELCNIDSAVGHEREVAVFSSVNNVGLVCDAGGGSSLHQRER